MNLRSEKSAGGGIPGGSDTQVQFNDSSIFGGDTQFTYNKTTDTLSIKNINLNANGQIDFNNLKAIEMVCDNGPTLPASPVNAQWFCHNPTGRKILYIYDGTAAEWVPIISIGTMTLFVDNTDGTDDLEHGFAIDSDAFKTVQFAINTIPGLYGGNVVINVNAETYNETVTIQGKNATGNFTIAIDGDGALIELKSAVADSMTLGSGASHGTLTHSVGAFAGLGRKLLYIVETDEYRIIELHTSTVLDIVGTFSSVPGSKEYKVFDWGAVIDKVEVAANQSGIVFRGIKIVSSSSTFDTGSGFVMEHCWSTSLLILILSRAQFLQSVFEQPVLVNSNAVIDAVQCLMKRSSGTGWQFNGGGFGSMVGNVTDGGTTGFNVLLGSKVSFNTGAGSGYNIIKNWTTGISAVAGGLVINTVNNQYSGNATDENPSGASDPAFID